MSGGSAADSSQNTAGTKKVNSDGSENIIISEESAHGGSRYVTRFFFITLL